MQHRSCFPKKCLALLMILDAAIDMLKTKNASAKGFRYEIEGAAFLKRSGNDVAEMTKRISVIVEEGAAATKTDIDVIVKTVEGTDIYCQFKRSTAALGFGEEGLIKTQAWVKKAMKNIVMTPLMKI